MDVDEETARARLLLAESARTGGVAALAPALEALRLFRARASVKNAEAEARKELAGCAAAVGTVLYRLGREAESVEAFEESVALYRVLVRTQPDNVAPDLAEALFGLGSAYIELEEHDKAAAPLAEAVAYLQDLAHTRPDTFLPRLADSLNDLGTRQLKIAGQQDRAATTLEEALKVRRTLVAMYPEEFRPELASSLTNLGGAYAQLEQHAKARDMFSEAAQIYRAATDAGQLADGASQKASFSNVLLGLGTALDALGQPNAAMAAFLESKSVAFAAANHNPSDMNLSVLGGILNTISTRYDAAGDKEAALEACTAAIEIFRELAKTRPARHLPNLARSLTNLALFLEGHAAAGADAAVQVSAAYAEATSIFRQLETETPGAHWTDLAIILTNEAYCLARSKSHLDRVLELLTEAITLFRLSQATHGNQHADSFARALSLLFDSYCERNLYVEARSIAVEAERVCRAAALPNLYRSVMGLATIHCVLGEQANAMPFFVEGITLMKTRAFTVEPSCAQHYVSGVIAMCDNLQYLSTKDARTLHAAEFVIDHLGTIAKAANPGKYTQRIRAATVIRTACKTAAGGHAAAARSKHSTTSD